MSNIPVNPTVLALSMELKDGAGKLYRLHVQDGNITFALLDTINKGPAPPIRSETVAALAPPPADGSDYSESTNSTDEESSGVIKKENKPDGPNKGSTSKGSHANTKTNVVVKNPVPAKNVWVVSKQSRVNTTKNTPATSVHAGKSTHPTANKRPPRAAKSRTRLPAIVFSDDDEDENYATGAASQEFIHY